MGRVEVDIMVAVAREDVWDVVSDVHRLGDWVTIHRGVEHADAGPVCEGFTMVQRLELNGADFTVDWTAVSVDAPDLLRWEGIGPGGAQAVTEYRLVTEDGGTRFGYCNDFDAPGGLLGSVVETVLVGDGPEEEAVASLDRLKRLLESS
jgi:carbon monoxide dehydrogenase subunit G